MLYFHVCLFHSSIDNIRQISSIKKTQLKGGGKHMSFWAITYILFIQNIYILPFYP